MSETEYWAGKLIEEKLATGETAESRMKSMLLVAGVDRSFKDYEDLRESWEDAFFEKYFQFDGRFFRIDGKQLEDFDIVHGSRGKDGNISFVAGFYNGGTCLPEVAERIVRKVEDGEK